MRIDVYCEDKPSFAIVEKVILDINSTLEIKPRIRNGKSGVAKDVTKINIGSRSARSSNIYFIAVVDLDTRKCPTSIIQEMNVLKNDGLVFCVAIQEIESWIMADRESISRFCCFSNDNIPTDVDSITKPKRFLLNTVKKKSRNRAIKSDLLPGKLTRKQGPLYNNRICSFIQNDWDIENACKNSPSLRYAVKRITELCKRMDENTK